MKFIVSRDVLYRNLNAISGVMGSNNSQKMRILDNVLLTIQGDKLKLTASDMESTMTAEIELTDVEGEGSICIPVKLLLDTLKLIQETPIVFVIDEENKVLRFTTSNGEYDAPCYDANEFPQIKEIENPSFFDIEAKVLKRAISKTLFATANDDIRPQMTGVLCELSNECITFVATDAHKLVRYRNSRVKTEDFASFILSKKPISHLEKILTDDENNVHVEYSQETHHVRFSFDNYTLYSSLKDGKYPNYDAVIPKSNPNSFVVSREDFLWSIRRVANYSNQSTFQVRVSLSADKTGIMAEDMDFSNKASEDVSGIYTGEPMNIGFNSKFLREMLDKMDSNQIRLEMSQPNRAALILPEEEYDENESLLMLIMPVMLNN